MPRKNLLRFGAQVVLKWNVQRGVAVIPRSQNPKNIKANFEGMFDWILPREAKVNDSMLGIVMTIDEGLEAVYSFCASLFIIPSCTPGMASACSTFAPHTFGDTSQDCWHACKSKATGH